MFVEHNEIRDIVGTASFCEILDHIISPVNPVRIGKYQAHLLRQMRVNPKKKMVIILLTLANCNNFELGSLDVVKIIFGSIIPALEYSLSMCVVGSTFYTLV
jgi:hypothetical protein